MKNSNVKFIYFSNVKSVKRSGNVDYYYKGEWVWIGDGNLKIGIWKMELSGIE